jgi:hypothetical protein
MPPCRLIPEPSTLGPSTEPIYIGSVSPTSAPEASTVLTMRERSLSPLAMDYMQGLSSEPIYIGPISPESDHISLPELSTDEYARDYAGERATLTLSENMVTRTSPSASKTPHLIAKTFIVHSSPTSIFKYGIQPLGQDSSIPGDRLSQRDALYNMRVDGIPTQIPIQQHDKFRRLLSFSTTPHVLNISMRGAVDLVDATPLRFVLLLHLFHCFF